MNYAYAIFIKSIRRVSPFKKKQESIEKCNESISVDES